MDLVRLLPGFVLAVVLITATPGPAFALVVQRTAVRGLPHGLATLTGTGLGLYTWVLLVASGLAVVAASEIGFVILKVVGVIVLAWFALRAFSSWWQLRSEPPAESTGAAPTATSRTTRAPFRTPQAIRAIGEGFTVQMANPKAAIFLLALYPQFVPPTMPLFETAAILGVVQVAIESSLYIALALGVHRAGDWFRRSVVRRRLEAATGTVLLCLGVRLAFSHR
ncbi:MAG: LysE family translocator [Gordonia polyisoprenivorans]|nr:LysE family translocator [Gordonia polyisoprenivorans]